MLQDIPGSGTGALRCFITCFRDDADFRTLARNDIRAALAQAGISVPHGVRVEFASNAARALSMALDHPADASGQDRELEDNELQAVAGGTDRQASMEEVRSFLSIFKHSKA
ncbi:hypothetical protein [Castellaniella sp.]|uniref:hypothetical protein n=1 Tax=Castellaniella sp. TaxID=1955812 RepID=UPI00356AC6EF